MAEPPSEVLDADWPGLSSNERTQSLTLSRIALRSIQAELLRSLLDTHVQEARELGASWRAIAAATGISPQAAHKRWDPEARAKARKYMREYSGRPRTTNPDPGGPVETTP